MGHFFKASAYFTKALHQTHYWNKSVHFFRDISSSQQNFFKMLDQKIQDGPDYDSGSETEMALEEVRMNTLVHHWESASLTTSMCSSNSRSLQNTPVRQANSLR